MNLYCNRKDLMEIFGFSDVSWIHKLVKHRGYPKSSKGKYNLAAWVQHREAEFKSQIQAERGKGVAPIERRKAEVELKLKEYDLARKQGVLIPKAFALNVYTRILKVLIDRRRQMGTKIGVQFEGEIGRKVKELIDKENSEIDREIERNKEPVGNRRERTAGRSQN